MYQNTDPEQQKFLDECGAALDEAVRLGLHLVNHLANKSGAEHGKEEGEDIPAILSLRHIVELLDAVSVLIRKSCIDPCTPLLREMLEDYLGLYHLIESDTSRRSKAYWAVYYHERIKKHNMADPSAKEGRALRDALTHDKLDGMVPIPERFEVVSKAKIERLEEILRRHYEEADKVYRAKKGNPKWYSLFSADITSIEQLARSLNVLLIYEVIYRQWSSQMHGMGAIRGNLTWNSEGKAAIVQIRDATNAAETALNALFLADSTYYRIVSYLAPEKQRRWEIWRTDNKQLIRKLELLGLQAHSEED